MIASPVPRRLCLVATFALALCGAAELAALPLMQGDAPATGQPATPLEQKLAQGNDALSANRLDAAAKAYQEAVKLDPSSPRPLLGLAEVARLRKDAASVERHLQEALRVAPKDAETQRAWGRFEFSRRQYVKAESAFRKATELSPDSAPAHIDLGDLYMNALAKPAEAEKAYRRALEINPELAGARNALGMSLFAQGKLDPAAAEFERAIALAPGNPLPLQALGRLEAARGRLDAALAAFDRILEENPKFVPARLNRGDVYVALGRRDDARKDLEAAAKAAPKNPAVLLKLAMFHQEARQYADAEKAYLGVLEIDPASAISYNNLAWMAAERGERLDDALAWAKKAVEIAPDVGTTHDTLGLVHRARKELPQAVEAFRKAAESTPPQAEFFFRYGEALAETGDRTGAVKALKRALEIDGKFPHADAARDQLAKLDTR